MELVRDDNALKVIGDLDRFHLTSQSQFIFPEHNGEKVAVDLAVAKTIDTAGLAWLLKLISFYQQQNKSISVINAPKQLIALAELSNVLALLPIIKSA